MYFCNGYVIFVEKKKRKTWHWIVSVQNCTLLYSQTTFRVILFIFFNLFNFLLTTLNIKAWDIFRFWIGRHFTVNKPAVAALRDRKETTVSLSSLWSLPAETCCCCLLQLSELLNLQYPGFHPCISHNMSFWTAQWNHRITRYKWLHNTTGQRTPAPLTDPIISTNAIKFFFQGVDLPKHTNTVQTLCDATCMKFSSVGRNTGLL